MEAAAHGHSTLGIPKSVGEEFVKADDAKPLSTKAAGILFLTDDDNVLFLKRGPGGDHPGEWCFPGGTQEDGESAEDTAVRETKEELGFCPDGQRVVLARRISVNESAEPVGVEIHPVPELGGKVDFTTFLQRVDETFSPKLNGEHTAWAWAKKSTPPEPLHPGARVGLERLDMDELGIARAMAAGDLTSPQRYMNVWLWAMRITATGMAYRKGRDEYVWRDGDHYLNDEFLARCNGLPVIWEHPKRATMDSDEFGGRIVGTVFIPYLQDKDVWGIVKVYDDKAAKAMLDGQLSTSPCVVLRDPEKGKVTLDDGSTLLVEGKPSLLDHLAICDLGVWDKAGPPTGVLNDLLEERADSMTDDEKVAAADKARKDADEKARMDADAGVKLDKLLSCIDSMNARMDAWEDDKKKADAARKDAEDKKEEEAKKADAFPEDLKKKADAAKKDGDMEGDTGDTMADKRKDSGDGDEEDEKLKKRAEEEKAREDAARKDSALATQNVELNRRLAAMEALLAPRPDVDRNKLVAEQARADAVYMAFGERAPEPMSGETPLAYKIRMTRPLLKHSARWKSQADGLHRLPVDVLDTIQSDVYADAELAARNPADVEPGTLREIVKTDPRTGQRMSTFVGRGTFIGGLKRPVRRVIGINTKAGA